MEQSNGINDGKLPKLANLFRLTKFLPNCRIFKDKSLKKQTFHFYPDCVEATPTDPLEGVESPVENGSELFIVKT